MNVSSSSATRKDSVELMVCKYNHKVPSPNYWHVVIKGYFRIILPPGADPGLSAAGAPMPTYNTTLFGENRCQNERIGVRWGAVIVPVFRAGGQGLIPRRVETLGSLTNQGLKMVLAQCGRMGFDP